MYGSAMGELHLDIFYNNRIILDVMTPIRGNQGNQWNFKEVDLSAYTGSIVILRFRGITGNNFTSDIAIDDIEIHEPILHDLELSGIVSPSEGSCNYSSASFITVQVKNTGSLAADSIPLAFQLNQGTIMRDTIFTTLNAGDSINHTFYQTVNLATPGSYSLSSWLFFGKDSIEGNDSILGYQFSSSPSITAYPDSMDFDQFSTGTPGTLGSSWTNLTSDDHDWYVHTGSTPSNFTGPTADHTSGSGNYMYVNATNFNNKSAHLLSPCYEVSNLSKPTLEFYYHMSGADMGELHVDAYVNGFYIQDILTPIVGDQGNSWNLASVDLTPYSGNLKFLLRGNTGSGYRSDIAIDDFIVFDDQAIGLNGKNSPNQIAIGLFPNPAQDHLYFRGTDAQLIEWIIITDEMGRKVMDVAPDVNGRINTSALPVGFYTATILTADKLPAQKRFIKN
jgi:hypothetical protein